MKLPFGIQTFRVMREADYCYVDKTPFIARLADEGRYYFMARPRRFGKSLFIDTMAEAFAGTRELFTGLYLEEHWDWDASYPVLRLDFSGGVLQSATHLAEAERAAPQPTLSPAPLRRVSRPARPRVPKPPADFP